jgi:hypothetical protein
MNGKQIAQPMRVQVRRGSPAEAAYCRQSRLPGEFSVAGAKAGQKSESNDLVFHGGNVVAQMQFQNVYLGSARDWKDADVTAIDTYITLAVEDARLESVIEQYFPDRRLDCSRAPSIMLDEPRPVELDEVEIQEKLVSLFDEKRILQSDLGSTIFNFLLPPTSILALDDSSSLGGLGGYHGSVHAHRGGRNVTLYYSASVFSEVQPDGVDNGVPIFDAPWKNVVATLYHQLNEFRTDPDVLDAILSRDNGLLGWMSEQGRECGDEPIAGASPLAAVFKEIAVAAGAQRCPLQLMYSNATHGPQDPTSRARV